MTRSIAKSTEHQEDNFITSKPVLTKRVFLHSLWWRALPQVVHGTTVSWRSN